ncbi:PREDICTED: uncharacterized protein LOC101303921 [Fragaria vesca subsp. vesca]
MPPRAAADGDLRSAFKAAKRMIVSSTLGLVIELVSDFEKVDEFLGGTPLQKAFVIYFMFIRLALGSFSLFNFVVIVYSLPSRFRSLRIVMCFSSFLFCGAIYYGQVIST